MILDKEQKDFIVVVLGLGFLTILISLIVLVGVLLK